MKKSKSTKKGLVIVLLLFIVITSIAFGNIELSTK